MEEIETRRSDGGDKATNMVYAVRFNEKSDKQHENRSIYTTHKYMHNEFPRGSTDVLEFKCTGPKGTGSATAVEGLNVNIGTLNVLELF